MSETKNKVVFGLSELHVGTYTDDGNGNVTLGNPVKVPGAVNMTLDPDSELVQFAADNDPNYYSEYVLKGFSGEFEQAVFDDTFKTSFLGYIELPDGGIALVKGATKPKVYFMFQGDGDAKKTRYICYNASLGEISRERSTTEGTNTPSTAKLPFNVAGDTATKIVVSKYNEGDTVYDSMFTTPPVPALPSSSE